MAWDALNRNSLTPARMVRDTRDCSRYGGSRQAMISYIHGTLRQKLSDRVVVDVAGIGYDVFLPQFVMRGLDHLEGQEVQFDIYYHVTERQIRPTLIGFNNPYEKRFFEKFISVEDIGPQKAARALTLSVSTIARAIESEDIATLRGLPGIGERTARKMVATLRGKVTEEALLKDAGFAGPEKEEQPEPIAEIRDDVLTILVDMGHRRSDASVKIDAAIKANPAIATAEDLIREVYRAEQAAS
jgi:holliday junction DNA helicase RuvA